MASNITIKDIVELKGCSIEEFIRLASEKGITLSEGENSEVSLAELRVIDPSLAYKLRYKKPAPKTTIEHSSDSQEGMAGKEKEQATQQTLHSLDSLGSSSKEASDATEEDSFFQKKSLILEELISMVDYAGKLTIEDVHAIRQKWEDCGIGRGIEFKDLYKKYELTLRNIYAHLSIDSSTLNSLYQYNLHRKVLICEALESIANDVSIEVVIDSLDILTKQWREAGPVDENSRAQINERFKKAKERLNKRVLFEKPKSVKPTPKEKENKNYGIRRKPPIKDDLYI